MGNARYLGLLPLFSEKAISFVSSVLWPPRLSVVGSTFGLLQTQPQLLEQAANVSRMIADPKLPSDHYSHSLSRPYISSKPVRLSSLSQKLIQRRSLIFTQTRRCARRRLVSQGFHAPFSGTLHPLAYGSFANPRAWAICVCFQPRSFSSKGRKRLPSRQSLAWLDNVFSIGEYSIPLSLYLYAEIGSAKTHGAGLSCSVWCHSYRASTDRVPPPSLSGPASHT